MWIRGCAFSASLLPVAAPRSEVKLIEASFTCTHRCAPYPAAYRALYMILAQASIANFDLSTAVYATLRASIIGSRIDIASAKSETIESIAQCESALAMVRFRSVCVVCLVPYSKLTQTRRACT